MAKDTGGPYLAIACFCHEAPRPSANGGYDLVGMFDAIDYEPPNIPRSDCFLILMFYGGAFAGQPAHLRVVARAPDGVTTTIIDRDAGALPPTGQRILSINEVGLIFPEDGVYTFSVSINGRFLTRIPVTIAPTQMNPVA